MEFKIKGLDFYNGLRKTIKSLLILWKDDNYKKTVRSDKRVRFLFFMLNRHVYSNFSEHDFNFTDEEFKANSVQAILTHFKVRDLFATGCLSHQYIQFDVPFANDCLLLATLSNNIDDDKSICERDDRLFTEIENRVCQALSNY